MNKEKQIEEMARDLENHICMSQFQSEIASIMLYNAGYRKASEVARNIFGNLRILGHIDFDGNMCIRKDSFEELEKIYTEDVK